MAAAFAVFNFIWCSSTARSNCSSSARSFSTTVSMDLPIYEWLVAREQNKLHGCGKKKVILTFFPFDTLPPANRPLASKTATLDVPYPYLHVSAESTGLKAVLFVSFLGSCSSDVELELKSCFCPYFQDPIFNADSFQHWYLITNCFLNYHVC